MRMMRLEPDADPTDAASLPTWFDGTGNGHESYISHKLSYRMKYDSQTTLQHLYLIDSSSIHHRASRHPRCQHLASKLQTGTGSGSDDKMAKGWLQA